ncbi:MAG TPA: SurA N-terminal domain-containing protein [Candidatus Saccharimonadales bacterium]
MKKLPFKRHKEAKKEIPSRITNETVAEHREQILAGGRRFKYPMQYARHKLVFNTIIVTFVTLVLIVLVGWWQLYLVQNTNSFLYRITRVLPLPVASVDGEAVRYSTYLMYLNSSMHYLQQSEQVNLGSDDGKRQLEYYKRKNMDNAIADGYAEKLAHQLGITISEQDVTNAVNQQLVTSNGKISQETYDASTLSVLGWAPDEYRQAIKNKLLQKQVAYAIDTNAKKRADQAATMIAAPDADFTKIAAALGGDGALKVSVGTSGMVPSTNNDGGLSEAAAPLQKGQFSHIIKTTTGDGYYFVRLLDKSDTQINYQYLRIPLTAFNEQLAALKKSGKIHEYISIPAVENQTIKQ